MVQQYPAFIGGNTVVGQPCLDQLYRDQGFCQQLTFFFRQNAVAKKYITGRNDFRFGNYGNFIQ
jgi:hypothetical protein